MAVVVTLNVASTSELDRAVSAVAQSRHNVGFFAEGLTLAELSGDRTQALYKITEEVEDAIFTAFGDLAIPGHSNMKLSRIFARAFSDTSFMGQAVFESSSTGGGTPSTYVLTDDSTASFRQTNMMPGTKQDLRVGWTPWGSHIGMKAKIEDDSVMFSFKFPHRELAIQALIAGHPSNVGSGFASLASGSNPGVVGAQNKLCMVNDAAWPTAPASNSYPSLPAGYWSLQRYATRESRYSGYYTLEAVAESRVVEDWSETGTLRSNQTGRYIDVDPDDKAALLALPYSNTVMSGNGIIRVGPYPMVSFPGLFGF